MDQLVIQAQLIDGFARYLEQLPKRAYFFPPSYSNPYQSVADYLRREFRTSMTDVLIKLPNPLAAQKFDSVSQLLQRLGLMRLHPLRAFNSRVGFALAEFERSRTISHSDLVKMERAYASDYTNNPTYVQTLDLSRQNLSNLFEEHRAQLGLWASPPLMDRN